MKIWGWILGALTLTGSMLVGWEWWNLKSVEEQVAEPMAIIENKPSIEPSATPTISPSIIPSPNPTKPPIVRRVEREEENEAEREYEND